MIEFSKTKFGHLPPQYNFSLNPYPMVRFSKCPGCERTTVHRLLPVSIYIDPKYMITLNYTNRSFFAYFNLKGAFIAFSLLANTLSFFIGFAM